MGCKGREPRVEEKEEGTGRGRKGLGREDAGGWPVLGGTKEDGANTVVDTNERGGNTLLDKGKKGLRERVTGLANENAGG